MGKGFISGFAQGLNAMEIARTFIEVSERRHKEQLELLEKQQKRELERLQGEEMLRAYGNFIPDLQKKMLEAIPDAQIDLSNIQGTLERLIKSPVLDKQMASSVINDVQQTINTQIALTNAKYERERANQLDVNNLHTVIQDDKNNLVGVIHNKRTGETSVKILTDAEGKPIRKRDESEINKIERKLEKRREDLTNLISFAESNTVSMTDASKSMVGKYVGDAIYYSMYDPSVRPYVVDKEVVQLAEEITKNSKQPSQGKPQVLIQNVNRLATERFKNDNKEEAAKKYAALLYLLSSKVNFRTEL